MCLLESLSPLVVAFTNWSPLKSANLCFEGTVSDSGEKKSVAVKVNSEKELMREMEKAASLLVLEQDWSVRIAAMERVEGLVLGGIFYIHFSSTMVNFLVY